MQRHTYRTPGEKIVDLLLGIVIWHVGNIGYAILFNLIYTLLGVKPATTLDFSSAVGILTIICSCLPFLINIALLIYFGMTRYWIALGMLGTFAAYFLIVLCLSVLLGVACFAIMSSISQTGF